MKKIFILICWLCGLSAFSLERIGADSAVPEIFNVLSSFRIPHGSEHVLSSAETEKLIGKASELAINVFELIDCMHRYAINERIRMVITGDSLRATENIYNLGDERVLAILPVSVLQRIETGAILSNNQNALDIFLNSEYESFIEIGTARYEKKFGFKSLTPLLFQNSYGVQVSKLVFSAPLIKLELYAPAKGAIYVRGVPRPKRWNLPVITEKKR